MKTAIYIAAVMTTPVRIQRKRTKGWKMPPNTISVCRPSIWGNPFVVGVDGTAEECVKKYAQLLTPYRHTDGTLENYFLSAANIDHIKQHLAGKNLACWCPLDQPCHADILLELASQ